MLILADFKSKGETIMGLIGTWVVRCPDGHDEQVTGITQNHTCHCGKKSVEDGSGVVVCPDGHTRDNGVSGITKKHKCGECGKECRR